MTISLRQLDVSGGLYQAKVPSKGEPAADLSRMRRGAVQPPIRETIHCTGPQRDLGLTIAYDLWLIRG